MSTDANFETNLKSLESNGFLLIENALSQERVEQWKKILYDLYDNEAYEINNSVGNVAFEKLLQTAT